LKGASNRIVNLARRWQEGHPPSLALGLGGAFGADAL
jgi:hypothetical protein